MFSDLRTIRGTKFGFEKNEGGGGVRIFKKNVLGGGTRYFRN